MELKKIKLPFKVKKRILSLGSHTKNTLCFIQGNFAYLSPVHPDLSNPQDFLNFEKDAKYFLKKRPQVIAYDLHPEYQSTKYALDLSTDRYKLIAIQHHHAHIASCMLDNGLKSQRVIGVAFDGTGLGSYDKLWGAEFLLCDYKNYKRIAHLKEIPLLGAGRAILEPARLALIWLYFIYKDKFLNLKIDFIKGINRKRWQVLKDMYLKGFNSPLASSMGRLFDAIASLIFAKYKASFEAELAIELERIAKAFKPQAAGYNFKIIKDKVSYVIDPTSIFKEVIQGIKAKEPKGKIAYRFHLTIANLIRRMCLILRKDSGVNKVILSGGVFKNKLLLNLTLGLLYKEGFKVFTHKELSCSDSGISLGQAVIANVRS